jgi:hypothetical protein
LVESLQRKKIIGSCISSSGGKKAEDETDRIRPVEKHINGIISLSMKYQGNVRKKRGRRFNAPRWLHLVSITQNFLNAQNGEAQIAVTIDNS